MSGQGPCCPMHRTHCLTKLLPSWNMPSPIPWYLDSSALPRDSVHVRRDFEPPPFLLLDEESTI